MSRILHFGVCIESGDPLLAGRIRGVFDSDFKSTGPVDFDENVLEGMVR